MEQICDSWMRKQDSPHGGFCSQSQTPYSPVGKAEFNVARAEHPVSENPHHHLTVWAWLYGTQHLHRLDPRRYRTPTQTRRVYHLFIHTSRLKKTDCEDVNTQKWSLVPRRRSLRLLRDSHTHSTRGGRWQLWQNMSYRPSKHTHTQTHTVPHTCCTMVVSSRQSWMTLFLVTE